MEKTRRHIGIFPALPLEKNVEIGEWIVGTAPTETLWATERFKELSLAFYRSFEGAGFKGGAMLWHRDRGFDGSHPEGQELGALAQAVTFATLDANDQITDDLNRGMYLATTENAAFFLQPIDDDGEITLVRGGALRRNIVGGWKIGDQAPPLADAVLSLHRPVRVSNRLASAIFESARTVTRTARNLHVAIEWHQAAMANPFAVTIQQRLIAIKTGFEALLRKSDSRKCARRLRRLFENCTKNHRDGLPWAGVLWAPNEKTNLARTYKKGPDVRSELEDWFMALADARNTIIHDGELPTQEYLAPPERPLSRYAGNLVWKGERLLREAIKAVLGPEILLCGIIARRELWKAIAEEVRQAQQRRLDEPPEDEQPAEVQPEEPEPYPEELEKPPRDLSSLLSMLNCAAANVVVLSKASGGASASLEVAREMAWRNRNLWGATAGEVTISISRKEKDLLEAAGAEPELTDFWSPCP